MTALLNVKNYHNPACGTFRNTLALIRNTGVEPTVIEYLITPPSHDELVKLIQAVKLTVREALRQNVDLYDTSIIKICFYERNLVLGSFIQEFLIK